MRYTLILGALVVAILTASVISSKDEDYDELQKIVDRKFDDSNFVWLQQTGNVSGYVNTALFFGYADNLSVCLDVLKTFEQTHPRFDYLCTSVSK